MKPDISLIMINHNRGAYISEAISSVIKQTLTNWELIIIDDASNDDSVKIITSFLGDSRLSLTIHDQKKGIGASRREAVKRAQAEIIGILDSDDALEENALEIMVRAHNNNASGLIYSQFTICDSNLKTIKLGSNGPVPPQSSNLTANRISHFITFKVVAYNLSAGYDASLNLAEDKDLFYKLEEVTNTLFIDQALYRYRLHPQGVSSYGWRRLLAHYYHFLVRRRAYLRRDKTIKRWLINYLKYLLDKFYFPLLTNRAISKFNHQNISAKTLADYWRLANTFYCGPKIRGININIRPAQIETEILALMQEVQTLRPRRVLEIGTATGGTLYLWTKLATQDATIISLDLPQGRFGGGYLSARQKLMESFPSSGQTLKLIRANSHDSSTKQEILRQLNGQLLDFLFIDGDHSYNGVKADWEDYSPLVRSGGLIALHDIAHNPLETASQVDRFWLELKNNYSTTELIADKSQGWAGIGLVKL